jgi:hypothetical protein
VRVANLINPLARIEGQVRGAAAETTSQAAGLGRWLREMELALADRILPIRLPVAGAWVRQLHLPDPRDETLGLGRVRAVGLTEHPQHLRFFDLHPT